MAQQTAVEWFIEKTTESGHLWLTDKPYGMDELSLIIEQAKQMEREQHKDTWDAGMSEGIGTTMGSIDYDGEFINYYNETYGK